MARGKKTKTWRRVTIGLFWKAVAIVLVISILPILVLRWLAPPTSAFMIQQRLSGLSIDYRWVPMERISPDAVLAVISSEDQNFFKHWGIDVEAIGDAIKDNRSRALPRGASTISQQVAKNLFLWQGRSYVRKGVEFYLTLLLEFLWPKHRILEVYLNIVELGRGVFGVEAAARRFFDKPAAGLNRRQAATLAAVLPNPRIMLADRPSNYVNRRTREILKQMNLMGGARFLEQEGM